MSGFAITLDALLALTIASLLITWSVDSIAQKQTPRDEMLIEYGYDFLTVADKTGALEDLFNFNSSSLKSLLRRTPEFICIEAEMSFQNGSFYYHADNYNDTEIGFKTGCLKGLYGGNETRPLTFVRVSRVAVYGPTVRPMTLELWYKGWK